MNNHLKPFLKMLGVTLLLLALVISSCTRQGRGEHVAPGEPIPSFRVLTLDGKSYTRETLLGQRSFIVFFDTWCPDCKNELPEVQRAFDILSDVGAPFAIIAVSRESDEKSVKDFWVVNGLSIPVAVPGSTSVYDLFDRNSGTGVPQGYLVDEEGVVRGFFSDKELASAERICEFLFVNKVSMEEE